MINQQLQGQPQGQANQWVQKKLGKYIVENNVLGKGQFGIVYSGFYFDTYGNKIKIAVKTFEKKELIKKGIIKSDQDKQNDNDKKNQNLDILKREAQVQLLFRHENILPLYDVLETTNNFYYLLEFAQDKTFLDYLNEHQPYLSESDAIYYLKQIVDAFVQIESKNACHRDLKPANLLMFNKTIKVADFGFARMIEEGQTEFTQVGTPMYMSPQAMKSKEYNPYKTDVWAAGVIFYQMLFGPQRFPWVAQTLFSLIKQIESNQLIIPDFHQISELAKDLLKNMLNTDEKARYTWKQINEHPIFNQNQNQDLIESIFNYDQFTKQKKFEIIDMPSIPEEQNQSMANTQHQVSQIPQSQVDFQILKKIHDKVQFIVNKSLLYKNIRNQFSGAFQNEQLKNLDQITCYKLSIVLVLKESYIYDTFIKNNPLQLILDEDKTLNQQNINYYLQSPLYNSFKNEKIIALQIQTNQKNPQLLKVFNDKLIQLNCKDIINQGNMNQVLFDCLQVIKIQLKNLIDYSIQRQIKSILVLLMNLQLLYNNENRLKQFKSIEQLNIEIDINKKKDQNSMIDDIIKGWH